MACGCPVCRPARRTRHQPREDLGRRRHDQGFAAVVLAGGYVEAGAVLFHRAYEHHLDRFDRRGAEVLLVPVTPDWAGPVRGRVPDPDALARAAERDAGEALDKLIQTVAWATPAPLDWPDQLAHDLGRNPSLSLGDWARARGLRRGSLSRGFRQVYGLTPQAFRLTRRAHRALEALRRTQAPLGAVALDCGFPDQAHMTRAVSALTGATPGALRRAM